MCRMRQGLVGRKMYHCPSTRHPRCRCHRTGCRRILTKMPPVDAGATCALDDVLQKAVKRAQEFVKNVDGFTASEFLKHEAIDKWGMARSTETRKFDYVVAVEELKPGLLNVEE